MKFWQRPPSLPAGRKVDFLIAGVQKGGTTSLDAYLRQHPDVAMSQIKEAHFFDDEASFAGGRADYAAYHRHFLSEPARLYGEATPIYVYWDAAMRRIYDYNPAMKLIVLLRDPAERAWSHWRMEAKRNADALPFAEAIRTEPQRGREARPLQHRVYSYVDRGFYAEQIRRVRRFFDEAQLHFVKSEDFFRDTAAATAEILRFLDLPPAPLDTGTVHFAGSSDGAVPEEDRRYLVDRFRHDIAAVEEMLGWDCADWRR
jgi:hypothetical protein